MSNEASTIGGRRLEAAGAALMIVTGLIAGCSGSSTSSSSALSCPSKRGVAVTGNAPAATGRPAAGWTYPDAVVEPDADRHRGRITRPGRGLRD